MDANAILEELQKQIDEMLDFANKNYQMFTSHGMKKEGEEILHEYEEQAYGKACFVMTLFINNNETVLANWIMNKWNNVWSGRFIDIKMGVY